MDATQTHAPLPKAARLPERFCAACGTAFRPTKDWQKFCAPACRTRYHKARSAESRIKALEAQVRELGQRVAYLEQLAMPVK